MNPPNIFLQNSICCGIWLQVDKGTVSIISSDPPWKDDKVGIKFSCFFFYKPFSFNCCFLLIRSYGEIIKKTTLFSSFFIRIRFHRYRCKSGIAIFTWRATWNYTYIRLETGWLFGIGHKKGIESIYISQIKLVCNH